MFNKVQRFSIRKLTVGAASVLIGIAFMSGANAVHAEETATQEQTTQENKQDEATTEKAVIDQSKAETDADKKAADDTAKQETPAAKPAEETKNDTQVKDENAKYKVTVRFINDYTGEPVYKLNRSQWKYEYVNPISGEFKDGETIEVHGTSLDAKGNPYSTSDRINEYFNLPGFVLLNRDELDKIFPNTNKWGEPIMSGDKDIDLTLHYAPLADTYIKYVDADTGKVLAHVTFPNSRLNVADPQKGVLASRYEAAAINIPGYELASEPYIEGQIQPDQVKTKGNDNPTVLVFKYKKITPNEIPESVSKANEGGIALSTDAWSALPGMFTTTFDQKTKGTITMDGRDVEQATKDLIARYENQGFTYAGTSGKILSNDPYNSVYDGTSIHLIPNLPVTVNYVDEQGNKLVDSDTLAFNKNNPDQKNNGIDDANYWHPEGEWQAKPKDIKGYDLVKTLGSENGKFTLFAYTVTYVYKKHVDQPTPQPTNPDNPTNPTEPTEPTTPSTPTETVVPKPEDPEVPTTPGTDEPETVRPHASEEPKVEKKAAAKKTAMVKAVKPQTAKAVVKEETKAELPQTGEKDSLASAIGLAMVSVLSFLGLADKKRKN